jgi:uncharacterized membrane protein YebE (DUF533 family)
MSVDFRKLAISAILADGKIDENEGKLLAKSLKNDDGKYSSEGLKFLIELRETAQKKKHEVADGFEKFFFKVMTEQVLKDGNISKSEVEWIKAHLVADGKIDDREWSFLETINKKAKTKHADFDKMFGEIQAKRAKAKK